MGEKLSKGQEPGASVNSEPDSETLAIAQANCQAFIGAAYDQSELVGIEFTDDQLAALPDVIPELIKIHIKKFEPAVQNKLTENIGWIVRWLRGEDETSIGKSPYPSFPKREIPGNRIRIAIHALITKVGREVTPEILSEALKSSSRARQAQEF